MAARKPSTRRRYPDPGMEMNITPMMNLMTILIPVLLVSIAFVELVAIEVAAGSPDGTPAQTAQPLGLRLAITEEAIAVTATGGGDRAAKAGLPARIPVRRLRIDCVDHVGTVPPPRRRNIALGTCAESDDERSFWLYDLPALTTHLGRVKTAFPHERAITISADDDVQYEAIVLAMDASREQMMGGTRRVLFDKLLLGVPVPSQSTVP